VAADETHSFDGSIFADQDREPHGAGDPHFAGQIGVFWPDAVDEPTLLNAGGDLQRDRL
jgi:hypothetical protein